MILPQQKLDALLSRHAIVERELSANLAPDVYVRLSREFAELEPVINAIKAYRAIASEIADLAALVEDPATDPVLRKLAETEKPALQERKEHLAYKIRLALLPKDT